MWFIRKISSFFSRSSFPEFEEFHKNLVSLRQSGGAVASSSTQAFGPSLDRFVQAQTGALKSSLETIISAGKSASDSIVQLHSATESVPIALSPFSDLGAELADKKKALEKANEDVVFAQEVLTFYQEALTKAEAKGVKEEIEKARATVDEGTQQLGRARKKEEEAQAEVERIQQLGSTQFFDTVVDELTNAVNAKLSELNALGGAANRILGAVDQIGDYEDKVIPILRARLEELEAPCVE
jgi:chromosome segregation ATPase